MTSLQAQSAYLSNQISSATTRSHSPWGRFFLRVTRAVRGRLPSRDQRERSCPASTRINLFKPAASKGVVVKQAFSPALLWTLLRRHLRVWFLRGTAVSCV